jgi:hypothetical protein
VLLSALSALVAKKTSTQYSLFKPLKPTQMRKSILILCFLISIISLQAQSLHKTWLLESISGQPIPEGLVVVMQFTEEGFLNMFSPSGNASTEFTLSEDKKSLELTTGEKVETWEIQSLSETQLVLNDPMNGVFTLTETDMEPNDLVIEEPIIDEPFIEEPYEDEPTFSIDSDFKSSKKDAKMIQGYWIAKSFNGVELPEEIGISIEFSKNGDMAMYVNGEFDESENATYKLNGQKLEINSPRGEEIWGIKSLGKTEMILLDKSVGEIKLEKAKKPKAEKK